MQSIFHPDFKTTPYWWEDADIERTDPDCCLPERIDTLVIGSGYCGLSAAAELAKAGVDAIVVDKGALGSGASTRCTGGVTGGQKILLAGPTRNISQQQLADMLTDSVTSFHYTLSLIDDQKLDAGLERCGRLLAAYGPGHYKRLCHLGKLLVEHTRVTVEQIEQDKLPSLIGTSFYKGGILIKDYACIHPGRYNRALRSYARSMGARLFSDTEVTEVLPVQSDGGYKVTTNRGPVIARRVVVATNGYTGKALPYFNRRLIPVASYHVATEELPNELMQQILPAGCMVSDSQRNLLGMRRSLDHRRLIFGARPTAFDRTEKSAAALIHRQMRKVFPQLSGVRLTHCWKGNVAMTFDRKPHIGQHEGLYYAVGCNGSGVAMMTYLGAQLAGKILGTQERKSAFETPHFPDSAYYKGAPWFVPPATALANFRDAIDRIRT